MVPPLFVEKFPPVGDQYSCIVIPTKIASNQCSMHRVEISMAENECLELEPEMEPEPQPLFTTEHDLEREEPHPCLPEPELEHESEAELEKESEPELVDFEQPEDEMVSDPKFSSEQESELNFFVPIYLLNQVVFRSQLTICGRSW